MNNQIVRLQAEMSENKNYSAILTQQFMSRPDEWNALRGSSSRNQERIDYTLFIELLSVFAILCHLHMLCLNQLVVL